MSNSLPPVFVEVEAGNVVWPDASGPGATDNTMARAAAAIRSGEAFGFMKKV
jgi:hypothetical protein